MSRFEIRLPHRDRRDHLSTVGGLARRLDPEDAAITRRIALAGLMNGRTTVAEELAHLERIGPEGRRDLLDRAREECGLESASKVEARERFEARQAAVKQRPHTNAQGERLVVCSHPDCIARPMDAHGAWALVPDRRWWCAEHRDQAGPDDHLPSEPDYRVDPRSMGLEPLGVALERERAELRRLRDEDERQAAERQAEAEQRAAVTEARRAAMTRPPGFGP